MTRKITWLIFVFYIWVACATVELQAQRLKATLTAANGSGIDGTAVSINDSQDNLVESVTKSPVSPDGTVSGQPTEHQPRHLARPES